MLFKECTLTPSRASLKKIVAALFFWVTIAAGCNGQQDASTDATELYPLAIGDRVVNVEIAATDKDRQLGLMFRKSMPENQGMLFVFEQERVLSFWMKNTRIPLSLAYITKDGTIAEIITMDPYDQRSHRSNCAVQYALEVNRGWFDKNGIVVGDKVELPDKQTITEK